MAAATLWIEITIAGAAYLTSVGFCILAGFRVGPESLAAAPKEFLPYLSVCFVAVSYISGIVAHRLVQIAVPPILDQIGRVLNIPELSARSTLDSTFAKHVVIWQYGSERLHREIDFQYALVALLRSLLFSLPLLGISMSIWLARIGSGVWWLPVLLALGFWGLTVPAYWRQSSQHRIMKEEAFAETERIRSLSADGNA